MPEAREGIEQEQVRGAMGANPLLWGRFYFGNHFRGESAPFHGKIMREAMLNKRLAIAAPRESAKSTIVSFLYASHSIAFSLKRFVIIIQSTYSKACGSLSTIKHEFRENQLLKGDFQVEITKDAEGESVFRHKDGYQTRILCKGRDQIGSIRGEKFGAYRPDLIIIDDVEDDEMVRNPELRRNLQEVFDDVVLLAGEVGIAQIFMIGTILHDDCQLAKMISLDKYLEFRKLKYQALSKEKDGSEYSLWSEKWTVADLHRIRQDKPTTFARELQNDPVAGLLTRFKRDDFRYWRSENLEYILYDTEGNVSSRGYLSECTAAISCDLAWSEKREADFSVIMGGFLTPESDILIDSYVCERGLRPDGFAEHIFSLHDRLKGITGGFIPVGMEKAMLENVSKWNLQREMRARNKFISLVELTWESDKITRNENVLCPRFSQHVMFFRRSMGDLEHQLLRFPSGTHDDLCLVGDTLIKTYRGDIPIREVTVDDLVMTRDGYKKVLGCAMTGLKPVIEKYGLRGTENHPIFVKTKGGDKIKRLTDMVSSDITYIWNEKLSAITESHTTDTQRQNGGNLGLTFGSTINGKVLRLLSTVRYGKTVMGQSLQSIVSTIEMGIQGIMNFLTLSYCPGMTTQSYTQKNDFWTMITAKNNYDILKRSESLQRNGTLLLKEENGIQNTGEKVGTLEKVYNLSVEGHEYLANNILVHNCDAITGICKLLQYPKKRKQTPEETSNFDWWRQKAIDYKYKSKEKKPYVIGRKEKGFELPAKIGFK
jgi:hypothetical protein